MIKKNSVSAFQLFSLLLVCRIFTGFAVTAPDALTNSAAGPLLWLPFFLLLLAAGGLLYLCLRRYGFCSLPQVAGQLHPAFGKAAGALLSAGAVWSAAAGAAQTALFLRSTLYPEAGAPALLILLILCGAAIACFGVQAICRVGAVAAGCGAFVLLFLFASTAKELEALNFTPPSFEDLRPLCAGAVAALTRTPELGALALLLPKINGDIKKGFLRWALITAAAGSLLYTFLIGATGSFGTVQMFPLYTLAMLARAGVFTRVDPLVSALWTCFSLLRTAFFLLLAASALKPACPKISDRALLPPLAAACLGLCLFCEALQPEAPALTNSGVNAAIFLLLLVLLPLSVWVAAAAKQMLKQKKKAGENK